MAAPSVATGCSPGSAAVGLPAAVDEVSFAHFALEAAPPRSTCRSSKPVAELPPPKTKTCKVRGAR